MALRTRGKIISAVLASSVLAAALGLWAYRKPIARDALDQYFAQHGVKASYQIKAIETRRQRLEHVRIGDPARPDLVADWVEIDVGPSFTGLSVKAFRAGGLRLWGQQRGQKISFGSVDRLLPPQSDSAFRLPRIDLVLEDARIALESPLGRIGLRLDGQGNVRSGFEGKLALISPRLAQADCAVEDVRVYGDLSVVGARPTYSGPARFGALRCGASHASSGEVRMDASLAEDARNWRGTARLALEDVVAPGIRLAGLTGGGEFSGDVRKSEARFEAQLSQLRAAGLKADQLQIMAKAVIGQRGGVALGQVRGFAMRTDGAASDIARTAIGLARAPLIGPLARQFANAVARSEQGISGQARFTLSHVDGQTGATLGNVRLRGPAGSFVDWTGKEALSYNAEGLSLAGNARFGGGGFPSGRAQFAGQRAEIAFAPFRARGAEARLTPVALRITPKGIGVETRVSLDGPVSGGRVVGLSFPLRLDPGQAIPQGCFPLQFRSATLATARFGSTRVRLCGTHTALQLVAPQLKGKWGQGAVSARAADATWSLASRRAEVRGFEMMWGEGADTSYVQLGELTAAPRRTGLGGRVTGVEGHLSGIALGARGFSGQWQQRGSALELAAAGMVFDRSATPRFLPLKAAELKLRLARGMLIAMTQLREPESAAAVARVTLVHMLSSGSGHADIDVPALNFSPALQPEALTPVTKGVVANVLGTVSGGGRINWAQGRVTSAGSFRSSGLDFAAAFGPVRGLAGEIHFSDLLGLATDGVQQARVAAINPGVEVMDGVVRYRILPDFKVAVEGARWPFAGGALVLEPTVLDMSESARRQLTFRAEGLDAARFIAAMQFENIAATGVYDGVLPMVFDAQGGRIEGGRLVARGGGTVSYVGPVSNENLGLMGRFAFDALKSMRYSRLAIDLNGAIDGDVITRVSFAGVNQAPVAGGRTKLPIKILGANNIPFIFNVTITAKFRQLFDMARSVNDPSVFINRAYPTFSAEPVGPPPPQKPVQPPERPNPR